MGISRKIANMARWCMDEWLPPIFRDSRIFYNTFFCLYYGTLARDVAKFKILTTQKDISKLYSKILIKERQKKLNTCRDTDVTPKIADAIFRSLQGLNELDDHQILDVGCGGGYLVRKFQERGFNAEGVDLKCPSNIPCTKGDITKLPFDDDEFAVVVCTHTLEHVLDIYSAVEELRRVARDKLIVVVPCQRPYKYTFDSHIWFFPYTETLHRMMGFKKGSVCRKIEGDLFYMEHIMK